MPTIGTSALPKFLHNRGGTFYFKRKLPAKVARLRLTKGKQVWKSLKTSVLSCALLRHEVEMQKFEEAANEAAFEGESSERCAVIINPAARVLKSTCWKSTSHPCSRGTRIPSSSAATTLATEPQLKP
jgi:hypothetical protein